MVKTLTNIRYNPLANALRINKFTTDSPGSSDWLSSHHRVEAQPSMAQFFVLCADFVVSLAWQVAETAPLASLPN